MIAIEEFSATTMVKELTLDNLTISIKAAEELAVDRPVALAGIAEESIVDGPGFRYVVFAHGCPHKCLGCHNPGTFDPETRYYLGCNTIIEDIAKNPLLQGVTFSGGEPFEQPDVFFYMAKEIHKMGLDIWCYTGYTFETLIQHDPYLNLLNNIDVLIDGKFILTLKDLTLKFRGSSNQRIIDVKKSLDCGKAITLNV